MHLSNAVGFGTAGGSQCGGLGFQPGGGTLRRLAPTSLVFCLNCAQPEAGSDGCKNGGVTVDDDRIHLEVAFGLILSTMYSDISAGPGHSCGLTSLAGGFAM